MYGARVAQWLRGEGHEVFSVYEEARGASDQVILEKAFRENRILLPNDKDFGEMIYRGKHAHHGVVFLRLVSNRAADKIDVLRQLLENYGDRLPDEFVVVTETQVRFARK